MKINRRSQSDRTAATRGALIATARRLFAARGYAAVGTPEIAESAGLSRGALYHQFRDKADLFRSVVEQVEGELTARLRERVLAEGVSDPVQVLRVAVDTWLEVAQEPEVQRLVLTEAPVVLGWPGWRELVSQYGLGLTEDLLRAAIQAGAIAEQPVRPLAAILVGALNEAALYVAEADDTSSAHAEARAVLDQLVAGVLLR